jgi:copper oxidase (laccase) domain-containing protein
LANRQRFLYAHHVQEASFFLAPLLVSPRRRAAFVERISDIATSHDKAKTLALLQPRHNQAALDLGFQETYFAEQVHGAGIAVITKSSPQMTPGVDGLVTREDLLLGIHVADCGALYLLDQETQAFGLLHSGKKGTELNITGKAIAAMTENFGPSPSNLIAIPSTIREQALDAGITSENYHDCGLCTASDLDRFYSYRLEKGNTGRLLALLGRTSS